MDGRRWKAGAAALAGALIAVGTASAGPAHAARNLEQQSVTVRVDDLNQASEAGARTMYSRLRAATRRVCGTPERDLREAASIRTCRERALADAVASAGVPRLTALHEARTGRRQRYAGTQVAAAR